MTCLRDAAQAWAEHHSRNHCPQHLAALAEAYMAGSAACALPDDAEPVDDLWLEHLGVFEAHNPAWVWFLLLGGNRLAVRVSDLARWVLCDHESDMEVTVPTPKNRGEARRLLAALGGR